MRSQSIIVFNLWAIMSIVHDLNSSRIVFWIRASVLTSTAAVASSRTRILDLRRRARARLSSCRCPTLKFSPASETSVSNPNGFLLTTSFKWALSRASHKSASLCSLKGSRLNLIVPENKTGV
uniref:Uncharacterized protein n=1 Tax=Opuntia streptacantha TaxID=393608 RepID=A0A7C9CNJ3_OPUST